MKSWTIVNKEISYHELKENSRMIKSQRSNVERVELIKDGIRNGKWWNY